MTAYTSPRTWATGELVTASVMNIHVRDQFLFLATARAMVFNIGDPNGGVINAGLKGYYPIPFEHVLTGWTLVADAVGSIVIDIWRDAYANFPPLIADTITASAKPTLSTQNKAQNLSLGTWSVTSPGGSIYAIVVDSCTIIKMAALTLHTSLY